MQNYTDALIDAYLIKEDVSQELNEWIDQSTFDSINPGDIINAKVYQRSPTEHSTRPVLVIHKSPNEVYGFYITSSNTNKNMDFYKVLITDLNSAGLDRTCYVNLTQEVNVKPRNILGPNTVRGHISRIDLDKIIEHLTDIYWARAFPFKYNIGMVLDNLKRIN